MSSVPQLFRGALQQQGCRRLVAEAMATVTLRAAATSMPSRETGQRRFGWSTSMWPSCALRRRASADGSAAPNRGAPTALIDGIRRISEAHDWRRMRCLRRADEPGAKRWELSSPMRVVPDKLYRHIASGFLAPVPVEHASRQTTGDAINVLG